jgi:hypothetical protein
MSRKKTDATTESLGKSKSLDLGEIGHPEPIEKVADTDFVKAVELEAFMNEVLTVIVHQDASDNAVENPCPSVNGINQPFIRGIEQKVKRKYVEALARGRVTKYAQRVTDASRPENIQMVETTALVYPFSVLHDPNPVGKAWLKGILSQPS